MNGKKIDTYDIYIYTYIYIYYNKYQTEKAEYCMVSVTYGI